MHGIETGFAGCLGPVEGCRTQTCRYVDEQALLQGGSAVSVLPLAWRDLGECLKALGQRDKVQDQVPKPFVLTLHTTPLVWQCSGICLGLWRVGYWRYLPLYWALTPLTTVRQYWSGFYNEDLPSGWCRKQFV